MKNHQTHLFCCRYLSAGQLALRELPASLVFGKGVVAFLISLAVTVSAHAQDLFKITGGTTNVTNITTQASTHPAASWYSSTPVSAPTITSTSSIISSSTGPYAYGNSSSSIPASPGSGGNKLILPGNTTSASFSVAISNASLATVSNPMLKFNHILLGGNGNPILSAKFTGSFGEAIITLPITTAGTWVEVSFILPAQVVAATGPVTLTISRTGGSNGANGAHFWALDDISISPYVDPCAGIPANTFRWMGAGSGTTNSSSDFDNVNNWCPVPTATNPLSSGHLQLFLTGTGTINMDANFAAASMEATISGAANNFIFNMAGFNLIVAGDFTANVASGDADTDLEIRTGAGAFTVDGTALIGGASTTGKVGFGTTANAGTLNFRGAVTFGEMAGIYTTWPATINVKGSVTNNSPNLQLTGSTLVFNGTTEQIILGAQPISVSNLTVNNAAGVTSTNIGLTVSGALTMTEGVLHTSDQGFVTLGTTGTVSENANSYVNGYLKVNRNISTAAQTFGGVGVTITAASGPYNTTVTRQTGTARTGASHSLNGTPVASQSIKRIFTVSVAGSPPDLNATMKFDFWDHELNSLSPAQLVFFRENPSYADMWINHGVNAGTLVMPTATTAGSITKSGIKAFSTWTLGSSVTPLPVELVAFTARRKGNAAQLEWKTASEENNAGYQIEVSSDNRTFENVAFVNAAENGNQGAHYAYTHEQASWSGTRYYRLTQHDQNGTKTLLGVRTVSFADYGASIAVWPNPFKEAFSALIESENAQVATLTLTDALGRIVTQREVQLEKGGNTVPFTENDLGNGLYVLSVQLETQVLSIRISKP